MSYTVKEKEINGGFEKEYEFFKEEDAIDTADKVVKIKVKKDTATEESLIRDKEGLQKQIDNINDKLTAIDGLKALEK